MTNFILKEPASELRSMARYILRDNWKKMAFGIFIYEVLVSLIPSILAELFSQSFYIEEADMFYEYSSVSSLYTVLTTGAFMYGLSLFFIKFLRFREVHYDDIFEGFSKFLKVFLLSAYMGIKIFLWALLLVIPGIIAAYRYRMSYYILIDDPKKGIVQCVNESKAMMMGNKAHLFGLDLSFIGWYILGVLPYAITNSIMGYPTDLASIIALTLINILPLTFVLAYMQTAEVLFYEVLANKGKENLKYPGEEGLKPGAKVTDDKDFWE